MIYLRFGSLFQKALSNDTLESNPNGDLWDMLRLNVRTHEEFFHAWFGHIIGSSVETHFELIDVIRIALFGAFAIIADLQAGNLKIGYGNNRSLVDFTGKLLSGVTISA